MEFMLSTMNDNEAVIDEFLVWNFAIDDIEKLLSEIFSLGNVANDHFSKYFFLSITCYR